MKIRKVRVAYTIIKKWSLHGCAVVCMWLELGWLEDHWYMEKFRFRGVLWEMMISLRDAVLTFTETTELLWTKHLIFAGHFSWVSGGQKKSPATGRHSKIDTNYDTEVYRLFFLWYKRIRLSKITDTVVGVSLQARSRGASICYVKNVLYENIKVPLFMQTNILTQNKFKKGNWVIDETVASRVMRKRRIGGYHLAQFDIHTPSVVLATRRRQKCSWCGKSVSSTAHVSSFVYKVYKLVASRRGA